MTNTTHTPGPWLLDEAPMETGDLTDWYCVTNATFDADVAHAVTEADARLISAAPELLAALEAVTACLRGFHAADDFGPLDDEAVDAALEAITKAKGA